jgi:hypothetical protein
MIPLLSLASKKAIPSWDPRARIGLNLGPSPTHARKVHLVSYWALQQALSHLNSMSNSMTSLKHASMVWQMQADLLLGRVWRNSSKEAMSWCYIWATVSWGRLQSCTWVSTLPHKSPRNLIPSYSRIVLTQTPSYLSSMRMVVSIFQTHLLLSHVRVLTWLPTCEAQHPSVTWGNCSRGPRSSNSRVIPTPTPTAPPPKISSHGRMRTMSHTMMESIDQRLFFGSSGMHYMSSCATATMGDDNGQTMEDHQHDAHLSLQDCMGNPIAFHTEMMGDIMYLNQALCQPDAAHFVKACHRPSGPNQRYSTIGGEEACRLWPEKKWLLEKVKIML